MEDGKKIYFAVKAFILNEGNFLIMHKSRVEEDIWELPGGRMEFGESAEETLIRELLEETGLLVTPIKLLDTWNCVFDNYQITGIIYLCKIKNTELKLSDEHDNYKWVNADAGSIINMYDVFKEKMINWNWDEIKSFK
ncbi:NUDIX domain-containing protein [Clostridium estertheticum]|uniref:NUDIX hydrolase n=1 Tax=Clostridium estertheticum TaxID=238834 RepID=UPI0013E952C9|nr:NUDIX domain-containing protein [Clostridium estertheticum]MBZ9687397.1 NUDIX domain-containing protein [Clostridium estertheticum]